LTGIAGDVGTAEGAKAFCEAVDALGKPVDVLVNNVGIFGVKDFWDITDEEWQHTWDVNVMSNVRLSRHFIKPMLERNQACRHLFLYLLNLWKFQNRNNESILSILEVTTSLVSCLRVPIQCRHAGLHMSHMDALLVAIQLCMSHGQAGPHGPDLE
jgi:NAD(P)-dependent dehydrogenase (short-subunit alcohol dehydrogenase family)